MKTSEEIKQALDICLTRDSCNYCPYDDGKCNGALERDAREYIEELETKLKTSELERKALSRAVDSIVYCDECVHYRNECCDYVTYIDEHDKVHRAKDVRDGNDYCSFGERREEDDDEQQ